MASSPVRVLPDRREAIQALRRSRTHPMAHLAGLAHEGPIVEFTLPGRRAFLLSEPALVEDALVTHEEKFGRPPGLERARRLLGQGLLTANDAPHAVRRRTVAPAFHVRRMRRYADSIVLHAQQTSGRWRDGWTIDLVDEMTSLALGVAGDVFFSADLRPLGPELRRILAAATASLDSLDPLVAPRRRLAPARARLDAMEATPAPLHDDALTMLLAGHDTIANALTWTWAWLSAHPSVEGRLHGEVDAVLGDRAPTIDDVPRLAFTRAVLAESLRLSPPAWILARKALEPHAFGETVVPAGRWS